MDISGLEDEFKLSRSMPRLLYIKAPAPEREPKLSETRLASTASAHWLAISQGTPNRSVTTPKPSDQNVFWSGM